MTGRGVSWSDEHTEVLIEIWSDNTIQSELVGSTRNISVYRRVADNLNKTFGFQLGDDSYKSAEQCRVKIKNLKNEYKKVADSNNHTGRGLKRCRNFDALDRIMKTRRTSEQFDLIYTADDDQVKGEEDEATNPRTYGGDSEIWEQGPVPTTAPFNMIVRANGEQVKEEEGQEESPGAREGESSTEIGDVSVIPPQSVWPLTTVSQAGDNLVNHNNPTARPTQSAKNISIRSNIWRNRAAPMKRKRKTTDTEIDIDSFFQHFAESQKASHEMEERRMKHAMEMEEKRRESEERMREADRKHQIQMMQLMIQAIHAKSTSPSRPLI